MEIECSSIIPKQRNSISFSLPILTYNTTNLLRFTSYRHSKYFKLFIRVNTAGICSSISDQVANKTVFLHHLFEHIHVSVIVEPDDLL